MPLQTRPEQTSRAGRGHTRVRHASGRNGGVKDPACEQTSAPAAHLPVLGGANGLGTHLSGAPAPRAECADGAGARFRIRQKLALCWGEAACGSCGSRDEPTSKPGISETATTCLVYWREEKAATTSARPRSHAQERDGGMDSYRALVRSCLSPRRSFCVSSSSGSTLQHARALLRP